MKEKFTQQTKPIVKKPISKKEIYSEYLDRQKFLRAFSLPVFCGIGLVFLCVPIFVPIEEDVSSAFYSCLHACFALGSAIMISGGIYAFCDACKKIKNFDKTTLNLYKRHLLNKPKTVYSADSHDTYVYEFAEFGQYIESSQSLGFGDVIAGDNYLLVCNPKDNKILQIYSLKHYELSNDVLNEMK